MINLIKLAKTGLIPDTLIRLGIRKLLAVRLQSLPVEDSTQHTAAVANFASQLAKGPLVVATDSANTQYYEVPAEFFSQVLGPRLKYSSCYFPNPLTALADAEDEMLRLRISK